MEWDCDHQAVILERFSRKQKKNKTAESKLNVSTKRQAAKKLLTIDNQKKNREKIFLEKKRHSS